MAIPSTSALLAGLLASEIRRRNSESQQSFPIVNTLAKPRVADVPWADAGPSSSVWNAPFFTCGFSLQTLPLTRRMPLSASNTSEATVIVRLTRTSSDPPAAPLVSFATCAFEGQKAYKHRCSQDSASNKSAQELDMQRGAGLWAYLASCAGLDLVTRLNDVVNVPHVLCNLGSDTYISGAIFGCNILLDPHASWSARVQTRTDIQVPLPVEARP